ncbi:MAG TPA: hypothetical protein VF739_05835 [Ktedonobacterales bacterium]
MRALGRRWLAAGGWLATRRGNGAGSLATLRRRVVASHGSSIPTAHSRRAAQRQGSVTPRFEVKPQAHAEKTSATPALL